MRRQQRSLFAHAVHSVRSANAYWRANIPGRLVARDQGPDDDPAIRVGHQANADCYDAGDGSQKPRLLQTVTCSDLVVAP